MKRCSKCGVSKDAAEFYTDQAKKDRLSSACKACMKARTRAWRKNNPERRRAGVKCWVINNITQVRMYTRRWNEENASIKRAHCARRRALKASAPQGDPKEAAAFAEILREGICELCGSHGPIEIDHIVPLSTGGEHGWENFAGLCKSCNASKHAKPLLQHMLDLA